MIETRYRSKLSKLLTYPIGSEALTHGLSDVPQIATLGVSYRANPLSSASVFRQALEAARQYPIFRAVFTRWDKRPSIGDSQWAQEYLRGVWRLEVFPVLRKDKSVANRRLLETGLPAIREWLAATRAPSWYYGRKHCDVLFSPLDGTVTIDEVVEAA